MNKKIFKTHLPKDRLSHTIAKKSHLSSNNKKDMNFQGFP